MKRLVRPALIALMMAATLVAPAAVTAAQASTVAGLNCMPVITQPNEIAFQCDFTGKFVSLWAQCRLPDGQTFHIVTPTVGPLVGWQTLRLSCAPATLVTGGMNVF